MPRRNQVLLVEDDLATAQEIEAVFRERGLIVTTASTQAEALALLEENRYGALVLDLVLRDGDGLPILSMLRDQKRELPVIVVTQYLTRYMKETAEFFSQVRLVASKPYPADALAASVSRVARVAS
jgi:DNA-binding response OmpR family regulator